MTDTITIEAGKLMTDDYYDMWTSGDYVICIGKGKTGYDWIRNTASGKIHLSYLKPMPDMQIKVNGRYVSSDTLVTLRKKGTQR